MVNAVNIFWALAGFFILRKVLDKYKILKEDESFNQSTPLFMYDVAAGNSTQPMFVPDGPYAVKTK